MRGLLSYKQPTTEVERTTLRIKADTSGNIYLPLAGYSTSGSQNCSYAWKVSIDAGDETNYSGTGSSSGSIRVGYGLKPGTVHTVTIKPQNETYGRCRALGFKGSSYAQYLINILSDKSYMGYAESATSTGNYFKYYQYYGCTNLLDTDDEVLPDTVKYIGDNYRAYEYAGCTSLKSNAQEKIFKQVKKIGSNYRAYQYQNCSSMSSVRMRAINWSTIGSGFRSNMLSGVGSSSSPTTITIEGGIVEGGGWGLSNSNVEQIKVYKGLVSDYQSKLSGITSTKIVNNTEWDTNNYEYIEFVIKADSNGDIKIPVAGYSTSGTQDCAYDWNVSVDGADTVQYTGTGSTTPITVGSGEADSEHRIIIYPGTESWGWGRAFGFHNSGIATLLTEFIHDSYKCYATSYTNTGAYFRSHTFYGCTLIDEVYERLPSSVSTIGNNFHSYDYYGCTGLVDVNWEVIPNGVSVGTYYRAYMYYNCSNIEEHLGFLPLSGSSNYRYNMFGNAGNGLHIEMWGYESLSNSNNSMGLTNSHVDAIDCTFAQALSYQENSNWSNLSIGKFNITSYPFTCGPTLDLAGGLELEWTKTFLYESGAVKYSDGIGYRDTVSISNVGLGVSDDESRIYFQGTYSRAGYNDCLIAWQNMSDLGVVTQPGEQGYSSSWYIRTTSPRGSQHDAIPKGISVYTSGSYQTWYAGWDWGSYTNWGYGYVKQYSMSGLTPTYSSSYSWGPFYYDDSNNSLQKFVGADRLRYNVFANERGITLYKYKDATEVNLGSTIADHIEFSDDGKACYILKNNVITQYSLSKILDFSTRTSTGKTFTIPSGCGGFTIKGGNLYCNNGATVYKYSIPNS